MLHGYQLQQKSWVAVLNVTLDIREKDKFISQDTLEKVTSTDMSKYQKKD